MPKLTHEMRVRFDHESHEWLRRRAFEDRVALAETIRACVQYAMNNGYRRYTNDSDYTVTLRLNNNWRPAAILTREG